MGVIICTYSAPVDVSNSNEGEVFALLVGCWELRLDGYNALIEGDYFSLLNGTWVMILIHGDWRTAPDRRGLPL